jgi:hypothetical protein
LPLQTNAPRHQPSVCPAALARSNSHVKRRFLQISLRGLLGLAALVCLLLGGWHWIESYGNHLDIEEVRLGETIRVKARYFWLLGPAECQLEVGYETADESELSDGTLGVSMGDRVKRSWLCFYSMDEELDPVDRPCQLIVYFKRHEKFTGQGGGRVWTLQEKIADVK